jgi:hypothetical protein
MVTMSIQSDEARSSNRSNSDLTRAINRQAHRLASQSFLAYRERLQRMAHEVLAQGSDIDVALRAVQATGLQEAASNG